MKIELPDELVEDEFVKSMRWHYDTLLKDSEADVTPFPLFDNDVKKDRKERKKLMKALKRVHNYYTKTEDQID